MCNLAGAAVQRQARARSDLPVTEMILDRDGRVLSVTAE
jgi:hypothetical protein